MSSPTKESVPFAATTGIEMGANRRRLLCKWSTLRLDSAAMEILLVNILEIGLVGRIAGLCLVTNDAKLRRWKARVKDLMQPQCARGGRLVKTTKLILEGGKGRPGQRMYREVGRMRESTT